MRHRDSGLRRLPPREPLRRNALRRAHRATRPTTCTVALAARTARAATRPRPGRPRNSTTRRKRAFRWSAHTPSSTARCATRRRTSRIPCPATARAVTAPTTRTRRASATACEKCHGSTAWKPTTFDHTRDGHFELRGSHAKLDCTACHTAVVAKQKLGTDCNSCHRTSDAHGGKLGADCARCHGVESWRKGVSFDHDLTPFPARRAARRSTVPRLPRIAVVQGCGARTASAATSATIATRGRWARTARAATRQMAGDTGSSITRK